MCGLRVHRNLMALAFAVLVAAELPAAQVVSTTARGVGAVMQHNGFYLQPAGSAGQFGGDLAPVQTFELIRPDDQRISVGRLFTSCTCVRLESPKQVYEPGEPAIFHLRNVRPTPHSGQTYAIYVQVTSPIRTTLRYDTFVQSSQFLPVVSPGGPQPEDIVADGVLRESLAERGGDIEIIVPKALVAEVKPIREVAGATSGPDTAESGAREAAPASGGDGPEMAKAADDGAPAREKTAAEDAAKTAVKTPETASAPEPAGGTREAEVRPPARTGDDDLWQTVSIKKKTKRLSADASGADAQ